MGAPKGRSQKATQLAVERLFDREDGLTAYDVMAALPGTCERYVRTVLTRLQDKGVIEAAFDEDQRLLRYRRSVARRPFLLGECWRQAFPVAEMAVGA